MLAAATAATQASTAMGTMAGKSRAAAATPVPGWTNPAQMNQTTQGVGTLNTAVSQLGQQLATVSGIPLTSLASLATLAVWPLALVPLPISSWRSPIEAIMIPARLKATGQAADNVYADFMRLRNELSETGLVSREMAQSIIETAGMRARSVCVVNMRR